MCEERTTRRLGSVDGLRGKEHGWGSYRSYAGQKSSLVGYDAASLRRFGGECYIDFSEPKNKN